MKHSFLITAGANRLESLLDTSGALWEELLETRQRLHKIAYLKKQNDEEILAACEQVQEMCEKKEEA